MKGKIKNLEKKKKGSMMKRNIDDIVKKENFILEYEYINNMMVIVKKK